MPVYIIRAGKTGPVKIGYSDMVDARMAAMQVIHYQELYLLRTINESPWAEQWFHREFAGLHIRREWFNYHPDMLLVSPKNLNLVELERDTDIKEKVTGGMTMAEAGRIHSLSRERVRQIINKKHQFNSRAGKPNLGPLAELMQPFRDWITDNGYTLMAFAKIVGCAPVHMSKIAFGHQFPHRNFIARVSTVSGGGIPAMLLQDAARECSIRKDAA